jgi:hypothetical protein
MNTLKEYGEAMAAQQYGATLFEGRLTPSVARAWTGGDVAGTPPDGAPEPQPYLSEAVDMRPERLRINAPLMRFKWYAMAAGGESLDHWQAGLLQSVLHAEWTAYYSNGKTLEYRLDTEGGPVRDGRAGVYPFYSEGRRIPAGSERYPEFDSDGPGVMLVTEYPEGLFGGGDAAGPGLLVRTQGGVRFASFLAVRNTRSCAIVTLGEIEWALSWDGRYDVANKTWTPTDPCTVAVITRQDLERGRVFADPASHDLPFSLGQEIAHGNHQIRTPQGWVLCQEGLLRESDTPNP